MHDSDTRVLAPRIVVCGVSGSGKTTVGVALARSLAVPFVDGDDLHPPDNIAKMSGGTPLSDEDRWPWLDRVGEVLDTAPSGIVVACSALRVAYRGVIRSRTASAQFVFLDAQGPVLRQRMLDRPDHFMPVSLLGTQLAAVEPLTPNENGLSLDALLPAPQLVARITQWLGI